MSIALDPGSDEPLYRQVRQAIEQAVAEGQFRDNPLPSSRALAAELGLSRTTINLAYQELVSEGFIYAEPRSGFRINRELISRLERRRHAEPIPPGIPHHEVDWELHLRNAKSSLPEISKDIAWWNYQFPFIYGQVAPSMFPTAAWNRAIREAMTFPHIQFCLRDSESEDDPMLVEQLCRSILPQRGIKARPENVLITLGTQHGLFLTSRVLDCSGRKAVLENPGYPDAGHILERAGARVAPVAIDESGLITKSLPNDALIIYTTPSHQFPTNVGLAVARRAELIEYATLNDAFIVEDDYDSEFRYVGRPAPALRGQGGQRVIYLGSFSKFLAPGLRLGYVVAEPDAIAAMRIDRRYSVRHPPGHIQRTLALLIASGDYHRTLRRNRSILRDKWRAMAAGIRRELGWTFSQTSGGTSVWVQLPQGLSSVALAAVAADHGVLVEPGTAFFMTPGHHDSHLRLGFSAIPLSRIDEGLRRLAHIARTLS